jgi:ankyrin repeat protein
MRDEEGKTALIYSVLWNGNPEILRCLINAGADKHDTDNEGQTLLMSAAEENRHPEIFRTLIDDENLNVNEKNNYGQTALTYVAGFNETFEIMDVLIRSGADVNVQSDQGQTPLMHAARFHRQGSKAVKKLLDAGADVNVRDVRGWTALMWAASFQKKGEFLKIFADAGAQVTEKDIEMLVQEDETFKNSDAYAELKRYASNNCPGS